MDKPWLQQYPAGVPHAIAPTRYSSLTELFDDSCRRFHDLPAFSNMGAVMTYAELERRSRSFGAYLQRQHDMRPGDRVAIMLPNLLQYPVALFGALRAGLVAVGCSPLYTARELEYQLKDSGATCIVVLENVARTLQQIIERTSVRTVVVTGVGDMLPPAQAWLTNLVVKHIKHLVVP